MRQEDNESEEMEMDVLDKRHHQRFNVVVVGSSFVGKSLILYRETYGNSTLFTSQIGLISCSTKTMDVDGQKIELCLIDVTGAKAFHGELLHLHCKVASALVFVYDVSDKESFQYAQQLVDQVSTYLEKPQSVYKVLIGNKCDLANRQVTKDEAESFANNKLLHYWEISAIHDSSQSIIEGIFLTMTKSLLKD